MQFFDNANGPVYSFFLKIMLLVFRGGEDFNNWCFPYEGPSQLCLEQSRASWIASGSYRFAFCIVIKFSKKFCGKLSVCI